jgi:transposase, IS5 family
MRCALRTLRTRVGRVMRDVERQVAQLADSARIALLGLIARTKRILSRKLKDKNKLYALDAPEVECLVGIPGHRDRRFRTNVTGHSGSS